MRLPKRKRPDRRASRVCAEETRGWSYGLLVPVHTGPDEIAERVRLHLERSGIRATLGTESPGRSHVLVFPQDAQAARRRVEAGPAR